MRQLVIDTETTGLNAGAGDRLIEIGCVELYHRRLTGNTLHFYLNPERESDPGALAIHGLTTEFLSDKPKFIDIAEQLCSFIQQAEIIIHNAPFDLGFLNAELARCDHPPFNKHCSGVIDTLTLTRTMFPGKRHNLDALCDRFNICRTHRKQHGALLDAELLAQVYLAMTRGQTSLAIHDVSRSARHAPQAEPHQKQYKGLAVRLASAEEQAAHREALDTLAKEEGLSGCGVVWDRDS